MIDDAIKSYIKQHLNLMPFFNNDGTVAGISLQWGGEIFSTVHINEKPFENNQYNQDTL